MRKRSVTSLTLISQGGNTLTWKSKEAWGQNEVRKLKKARECLETTLNAQACHMSTTIFQQRKNDGVSWVESQTGAQNTEIGSGASLHVAEVTLCTSDSWMLPFVDLGLLKHCNNSQHLTALCSTYCNRRTRFVPQSPWQARQGGSSSHVTHVLAGGPRNQRHGKHILSADLTRATSDENSRQMSTTTNKC